MGPPQGEGWFVLERQQSSLLYARRISPTHSVLVLAVVYDTEQPVTRQADLVDQMEAHWAETARDVSRYRNPSSRAEPLAAFGGRCVRYTLSQDDHGAFNKGDAPFLRLVARGIICFDRRNPERLFRVAYSERSLPAEVNPDFEAHADAFLNGLQLNETP